MRLSSILALATAVGVGGYLLVGGEPPAAAPAKPRTIRTAALPAIAPRSIAPSEPDVDVDDLEPIDEPLDDDDDDEIHGHDTITDPAELAMLFEVDGVTYLRLSQEERATARGTAKLIEEEALHAVVAPVAVNALPPAYRGWAGKRVLVEGVCEARVVGFAEVSRVYGEAGDPYAYDEDGNRDPVPPWTIDLVTDTGVTLAARLDRCDGAWARAADYASVAVGGNTHDPALEDAARTAMFAAIDDELTDSWTEMGGEGTWRAAADVVTTTWQHPLTDERWVFVQVRHPGSCGEPTFSRMAVYRVRADGKLREATTLSSGGDDIHEILDLDGDGQPELLVTDGDAMELVDLKDTHHDSMRVPQRSYGCPC